jgi:hypothetical protein
VSGVRGVSGASGGPGAVAVLDASAWDQLVAIAVLGTERRPYAPAAPVVAEFESLEGSFIAMVAAVWALREAGRGTSPITGPKLASAPLDGRPLLPSGAVTALGALLTDRRFRPVLPEWLRLAVDHGGRLPAELVPVLLDAGPPNDPAGMASVAGPLGGWLAELNSDWAWVTDFRANDDDETRKTRPWTAEALNAQWTLADTERLSAWRQCRRQDPELARGFLERVWPDEPNATKAAMVLAFTDGLSLADEVFLERAAGDRLKDVKQAAISLLSVLPGSRVMEEAKARATAAVHLEGRVPPGLKVTEVPGLEDLVAATPLSAWPAHFGLGPPDLVRLAGNPDQPLVRGWGRATIAQADSEWAEALLAERAAPLPELRHLLRPQLVEEAMVRLADHPSFQGAMETLVGHPRPWSARLSAVFFASLARLVSGGDTPPALVVRDRLAAVALAADPGQLSAAEGAMRALGQVPDDRRQVVRGIWEKRLADMLAVLHFRRALHQEFQMTEPAANVLD